MSGWLAGKVWQSALEPWLKPTAAALADITDHDGAPLLPRVEFIAWCTGESVRATQYHMAALRRLGVLKRLGSPTIGRGQTVEYSFQVNKLPKRPKWSWKPKRVQPLHPLAQKRVQQLHPFAEKKGATSDMFGDRTLNDPYVRTYVHIKGKSTSTTNKRSTAGAFDRFWTVYPRKVGKDSARKAFQRRKFTADEIETVVQSVETQKQWPEWTKSGGEYIPHPATWLNRGGWTDEPHLRDAHPQKTRVSTYEDRRQSGRMNPWDRILATVETQIDSHAFHKWFVPIVFVSLDATTITVRAPGDMFEPWIRKQHGAVLEAAMRLIEKSHLQLKFVHD